MYPRLITMGNTEKSSLNKNKMKEMRKETRKGGRKHGRKVVGRGGVRTELLNCDTSGILFQIIPAVFLAWVHCMPLSLRRPLSFGQSEMLLDGKNPSG